MTQNSRDAGAALDLAAEAGSGSLKGRDILVLSPTPTWPLDAGNRRRVFRVCRDLQLRGARVHFLYYPFEWPFTCVPQQHLRQMAAQWDSFFLAPVSRPLQSPPAGAHHLIDEWWDSTLDPMLHWLMERGRYDAFIVNYPYLSRALEFAPKGTLKILDMHDRFAGRREVLAGAGVAPEFFYTTDEEEKKALDRADMVWAIKEQEAEAFKRITGRVVLTLPHYELRDPLHPKTIDPAADLVLGMVGARNSVNLRNAMMFIEQVLPLLRRQLIPVRIRFGGGMCADLEALPRLPSGVELAGRFEQPEDFYGQVDAVLVPLAHSTGLKIKAVEAFSLGLPVIAHRHAVEGIPVEHPFHRCDGPKQLADAIEALALDRQRLAELRTATLTASAALTAQVQQSMSAVAQAIVARPTLVVAAAPEFMDPADPYAVHLFESVEYLKHLGDPVLYVDRPLAGGFERWRERLNGHGSQMRVVFSPDAALAMGLTQRSDAGTPFPLFYSVERFSDLLGRLPRRVVWLSDVPAEVERLELEPALLESAYLRVDAWRLLGRWPDSTLTAIGRRYASAVIAGIDEFGVDRLATEHGLRQVPVPFWRHMGDTGFSSWSWDSLQHSEVWILSSAERLDFAQTIQRAVAELQPGHRLARLILPNAAALSRVREELRDDTHTRLGDVRSELGRLGRREHRPRVIVDASLGGFAFAPLREAARRLWLPLLTAYRRAPHDSAHGALGAMPGELCSVGQLIDALASLLSGVDHPSGGGGERYQADAGWEAVWREVSLRHALFAA